MKRIKEGEIIIQVGYKCKKLCVSSVESYRQLGNQHTKQAKKVGWLEVGKSQRRLTCTGRAVCNIFKVGGNGTEDAADRVMDNYSSESCIVPIMRTNPKTHKARLADGNPQTRPVVGASSCMTSRASEALCDILVGVVSAHPNSTE